MEKRVQEVFENLNQEIENLEAHASSLWCKSRFLDEKDFVIHSDRS